MRSWVFRIWSLPPSARGPLIGCEAMAAKFGVGKTTRDYRELLANPASMRSRRHDVGPARRARRRGPRAGKHVLLEKPMASTLEDARRRRRRRALEGHSAIGHICRFNPRYPTAKNAIAEGSIGKIVSMSARRNIPAGLTSEILNKIGPIVGDGVHDTDLMLWYSGDRMVSAYAQTVDVRGREYPDLGQTMYRFAGGATASWRPSGACRTRPLSTSTSACRSSATPASSTSRTRCPISASCRTTSSHSPDTTYWPVFDGDPRRSAARGILLFRRLRAQGREAGDRQSRRTRSLRSRRRWPRKNLRAPARSCASVRSNREGSNR